MIGLLLHGVTSSGRRFIILTRQRGGSHFLRTLLTTANKSYCHVADQEKIKKGDERARAGANYTAWALRVEESFEELEALRPKAQAIGFAMHHKQVWCHQRSSRSLATDFSKCMIAFAQYAKVFNIKILHLSREAVLMMVSSSYLSKLTFQHTSMTTDAGIAAKTHDFASEHPMPLDQSALKEISLIENEVHLANSTLQNILNKDKLYFYLRYESLLDPSRRINALREAFQFLEVHLLDSKAIIKAQFKRQDWLPLHPATCKSRVADWNSAKLKLNQSTRAACKALDQVLLPRSSLSS